MFSVRNYSLISFSFVALSVLPIEPPAVAGHRITPSSFLRPLAPPPTDVVSPHRHLAGGDEQVTRIIVDTPINANLPHHFFFFPCTGENHHVVVSPTSCGRNVFYASLSAHPCTAWIDHLVLGNSNCSVERCAALHVIQFGRACLEIPTRCKSDRQEASRIYQRAATS